MGGYNEYAVFVRLLRAVSKFCESSRPRPSLLDFGELDPEHDLNAVLMGRGEDWLDALWARMSWERRDGAQIVTVGDRYQQIYSWRGAINAMERYETS